MLKKKQTQQIILSLSAIILLSLVSTLFYLIDDAIDDHDISVSGIKVIEENSSSLGVVNRSAEETPNNYLKSSDKSNNHYLSEIQDLHDSLQNDIEEKSKATVLDKKKVED
ncbi:MAG: hypothetical protein IE881_09260, partial [Epsilonproteobacteria bacterium]|nr:hypothetical protein [Campylobacterota bacterium]